MSKLNFKLIAMVSVFLVVSYFAAVQMLIYFWSQHGEDVLNQTKCITYTDLTPKNEERYVIVQGDPRFEKVKSWTQKNLFNRLYSSWWIQTIRAEMPSRWIAFYSVTEPKNVDNEGLEILHFCPETLSLNQKEVEQKVAELRTLLVN